MLDPPSYNCSSHIPQVRYSPLQAAIKNLIGEFSCLRQACSCYNQQQSIPCEFIKIPFSCVSYLTCRSPNAELYLKYLNVLLSTDSASIAIGAEGPALVQVIVDYLIRHGFYDLLGQCVSRIVSHLLYPTIFAHG